VTDSIQGKTALRGEKGGRRDNELSRRDEYSAELAESRIGHGGKVEQKTGGGGKVKRQKREDDGVTIKVVYHATHMAEGLKPYSDRREKGKTTAKGKVRANVM